MRKQHELFCCKLCLKHLKVCPYPQQYPPKGLRGTQGVPGGGGWWPSAMEHGLSQTAVRGWLLPLPLVRPDP